MRPQHTDHIAAMQTDSRVTRWNAAATLMAALLSTATAIGQTPQIAVPSFVELEDTEFAEAIRNAETDPYDTSGLEQYLRRHHGSRHHAEAVMAIERAQLLTTGNYILPASVEPLLLSQVRPTERTLQVLYDGQGELNAFASGTQVDIDQLKNRYLSLVLMGDETYRTECQYYLGYCEYAQGNYETAENYFRKLEGKAKYEPALTFYRMQMAYGLGQPAKAMTLAHKIEALPAGTLNSTQLRELTRVKAECLMMLGDDTQALTTYEDYIASAAESNTTLPVTAYNAAVMAYKAGRTPQMRQALAYAVKADDALTRQQTYMLLGQSYVDQREYTNARMAFSQAANIANGDEHLRELATYNVASCVHQTTQSPWGDEVALLEQFLNDYPESEYAGRVTTYLTDTYMTTRNYQAGLESIARIQQPTRAIQAAQQRLLVQQGLTHYANGEYTLANDCLTRGIDLGALTPKYYSEAYYWRAECLYHQHDYEGAIRDIFTFNEVKPATQCDPRLAALAYYNLGYCRMQQQEWDKACTNFERYLSQPGQRGSDTYTDAMMRLGDCHYYNRQFLLAESYYKSAAQSTSDPDMAAQALYQEATMRGVQKKYAEKQQTLDELLSIYPESEWADNACLEKGRTYTLQNNHAAAIQNYQRVLDKYADSECAPAAAIELAIAYNNMGKTDLAIAAYKHVAERYPNSEEALTAVGDLKAIYLERGDVDGYAAFAATHNIAGQLSAQERDSLNAAAASRLVEEGRIDEAYQRYKTLANNASNPALRAQILPVEILLAYDQKDYDEVISSFQQMVRMGGYDQAAQTEAKLMAGLAYTEKGMETEGDALLGQAASDTRTAAGAKAKYTLAQLHYDRGDLDTAENIANEMLAQGTTHQYWLARTVILLSDIATARGDEFTAQEFLKSLKLNYTTEDDIQTLISNRLNQ